MTAIYRNKKLAGQPRQNRVQRPVKAAAIEQCLIVSANPARQSMFVQSAADAGWETMIAADPDVALTCIGREFLQLAIVDIEDQNFAEFQQVLNRLRLTSGLLLVVCGNADDADQEIAARQLSPWLYLPGVELGSDLVSLCEQARLVAQRSQATAAGSQFRTAAAPVRRIG